MNKHVFLLISLFAIISVFAADNNQELAKRVIFIGDVAPTLYSHFNNKMAYNYSRVCKLFHTALGGYRGSKIKEIDTLYPNENGEKSEVMVNDGKQIFKLKSTPLLIDASGNNGYLFSNDGVDFKKYEVPVHNLLHPKILSKTGMKKVKGVKLVNAHRYGNTKKEKDFGGVADSERKTFIYDLGAVKEYGVLDEDYRYTCLVAFGTPVQHSNNSFPSSDGTRVFKKEVNGVGVYVQKDGTLRSRLKIKSDKDGTILKMYDGDLFFTEMQKKVSFNKEYPLMPKQKDKQKDSDDCIVS